MPKKVTLVTNHRGFAIYESGTFLPYHMVEMNSVFAKIGDGRPRRFFFPVGNVDGKWEAVVKCRAHIDEILNNQNATGSDTGE